jgi:single-stranded-DNA-specific exonuclease
MNWKIINQQSYDSQAQLIDQLLINRNIEPNSEFFKPISPLKLKPEKLGFDLDQLSKAKKLLKKAIKEQKKLVIFGDYDADGITAASIVWLTLKHLGLISIPFIPDRQKHGYGLSVKVLKEIVAEHQPEMILTVDNGIVANEAIDWATDRNLEVILTDHHQPFKQLPKAQAIVHSTEICGAAVAWMLMRELDADFATNLLDLVGVATVADQMPLIGANRSFVYHAIKVLQNTQRVGLKALYKVAGIDPKTIDSYTIGFVIAPRINAVGRLSQGIKAMRLLCTGKLASATALAQELNLINQERQDLTVDHLKIALEQARKQTEEALLFIASEKFHEGVVGLLAGRLTEKFYKPCIVVGTEGKVAKASARSITGVNITELIREVEPLLLSVGGHELAAGFSADPTKLDQIKATLQKLALTKIDQALLTPQLKIDLELKPAFIDRTLVNKINQLAPFGMGNSQPIFATYQTQLIEARTLGKEQQHLKLILRFSQNDYQSYEALAWHKGFLAADLKPGQQLDVAYNLELNTWNGRSKIQLKLKDFKDSAD